MKRKSPALLGILWLLTIACIAGSGGILMFCIGTAFGGRWISAEDYAIIERYSKLEAIRCALIGEYYPDADDAVLMDGAARGMLGALDDPYTFYYSPEEMQEHTRRSEGGYTGMGILVQMNANGAVEVIRVYENGPAHKAGVQSGDLITGVNGDAVSAKDQRAFEEAVQLLSGQAGSEALLRIKRGNAELELYVTRGDVYLPNVRWQMLDNGIGYIAIYQFGGDVVEGFRKALSALRDEGAQGIVLDLRNNPGGLLDDVVEIADTLLPEGLIFYTLDRNGNRRDYVSDPIYCELPMAVLINGSSASASEILAAALQYHGSAVVIGEQSYGKGIVQAMIEFEDGSGIQYTCAGYYTPSGESIHGKGVTPDVEIKSESKMIKTDMAGADNDVQLQKAVELLGN